MIELDRLINKVLKGNRKAQSQFYDEFSGFVMGVCHRYGRNESESADIFQESFVKIFLKIGSLKDVKTIYAWIKRITVNTAIDHLKSIKFHDSLGAESLELSDQYYSDMLDKMSTDVILEVINKLPEGYKIIFNLSVIDGYSHKEIASQLKISESTSRSQLTHAKKVLKRHLNELGITRYEQVI